MWAVFWPSLPHWASEPRQGLWVCDTQKFGFFTTFKVLVKVFQSVKRFSSEIREEINICRKLSQVHWGQGPLRHPALPGAAPAATPALPFYFRGNQCFLTNSYPTLINYWYFLSHTSVSFRFRLQGQDRRFGLSTAPMSPSLGSPSVPIVASDLAPTDVR